MNPHSSDPGAESLLLHASWLRRMARSLVGEGAAEDLVQETWVAALKSPPGADRPLRPWLFTVLRNFARRAGRRRPAGGLEELRGAADESLPGPEELCEGLETGRAVAAELASLEEPYRSTLLLRFYQDIAPAEIARRQGVPAGTVRWRLSRGLELLRERLDGRFGDRGVWCSALLPLAHTGGEAALGLAGTSGVLSEILAMKISFKLGAAVAILLAVVAGITVQILHPIGLFPSGEQGQPVTAAFRPLEPEPEIPPGAEAETTQPGAERTALRSAAAEVEQPTAIPAAPGSAFVEAEIVDEQGRTIVGAQLRELTHSGPGARATALPSGRVRLELDPGGGQRGAFIEALARGHASRIQTVRFGAGEVVPLGRIELELGGVISGRVVDEEGHGVAGALVTSGAAAARGLSLELDRYQAVDPILQEDLGGPITTADDRGEFTLAGLPEGFVRLWARCPGYLPTYTEPVEVRLGQESFGAVIEIQTIREDHRIEGLVLDPAGAPVPRATLRFKMSSGELHSSITSDKTAREDGTFAFVWPPDAELSLTASDPGDRYVPATLEELRTGELNLVLRLGEGPSVALRVRGADGEPLKHFAFEVLAAANEELVLQRGGLGGGDALEASLRLPGEDYLVRITAPLCRVETAGPFEGGLERELIELHLVAAPGLHGRVRSPDGEPVAGAAVELRELVPEVDCVLRNGLRCWQEPLAVEQTATDEEGRFLLTPRAAGGYVVRVEAPDFAPAEWGPIELAPDLETEPAELELGPGGAIEGRVVPRLGEEPTGTLVAAHRGDGDVLTQRVGPDGLFRFEGLMPGPWEVVPRDQDVLHNYVQSSPALRPFEDDVQWNCHVYPQRTTCRNLYLAPEDLCAIAGQISIDGIACETLAVWACPEGEVYFDNLERWPAVGVAPDGTFELSVPEPGLWRVVVKGTSLTEEWAFADLIQVEGEVTPWELDVRTGSLTIDGHIPNAGDQNDPSLIYFWDGPGRLNFIGLVPPSQDDSSHIPRVPAGTGLLVAPDFTTMPDFKRLEELEWGEVVKTVEIMAGAETRVPAP